MTRIAVLVSGGGTNLQALIDAQRENRLGGGEIVCVVSSKSGVYALDRAMEHRIPAEVVARKDYHNLDEYDEALRTLLGRYHVDLVVLAGFLSIVGPRVLATYGHQIINVHPALIPSFCGPGYYGLRVHKAALEYGVKVTGATVHFVNEVVDGGEIILQKAIEIDSEDTPESLQRRVMEQCEWELLPRAVELFCQGRLTLEGKQVLIQEQEEMETWKQEI